MKRFVSVIAGLATLAVFAGAALAHGPMGMRMGMGPGMGPGMMHGAGAGCPGMIGATGTQAAVTEERAKELAKEYVDKHLPGFTVDKVLPFTNHRNMTMYSIELKGPQDELRVLHVNPFGNVMPFGGPWRRGA